MSYAWELILTVLHGREDALIKAMERLGAVDEEAVLLGWLEELRRSSSDWPNFQKLYSQWCDRARQMAQPRKKMETYIR